MTAFANVNGNTATEVELHVPNAGPWWADVTFELSPEVLTGDSVALNIGPTELTGTVLTSASFGEQRKVRIVAGAGGWGTLVTSQHYHSDGAPAEGNPNGGGISARTIADDAARLAGETIGTFVVTVTRIGIDYVRESGPASRVLEDVIGDSRWHVDYGGATNVGPRTTQESNVNDYQILDFDARNKLATMTVDDLSTVMVGYTISEGLSNVETIRELEVKVSADSVRVIAWVGGDTSSRGRLADAFSGLVNRSTDKRLFGLFQYRLLSMSGDRLELQVVNQDGRMPDTIPLSMKPGVAGAHAKLTPGSIVLVQFVDGLRTLPVVTAFAGRDTQGHEAQEVDFSVAVALRLGGSGASEGVTLGDSHKAWADAHTHVAGLLVAPSGGGPVTGTSGAPVTTAPATSSKVKVE